MITRRRQSLAAFWAALAALVVAGHAFESALPNRASLSVSVSVTVSTAAYNSPLFRSQHYPHPQQQQQYPSNNALSMATVESSSSDSSSSQNNATTPTKKQTNQSPSLPFTPPRKVVLMVEPTPFTHVSGYANRFKEMLKFMKKAGDEFDILTVDSKTPAKDLPDTSFGYNIFHTLGFTFPLYNQISLTLDLPELKGVTLLERKRPELIHVTSPGFMLFPAILYARAFQIPLLMSYHTHLPSYAANYLGFIPYVETMAWWSLRWVHKRADLTLVTSPQMKAELESHKIPRVDVWRKGIDTERFNPTFRSSEMRNRLTDGNPDDFLLIYVGRLGAEKRLKDIKPMLESIPNSRFCVVGKGPQMKELEEYFKDTNTKFMGQLSGDELSQAFASADVFCMPSDSETLGFVVLESMASGVPVVGANAGGIPSLIDHEHDGFLVEPGDVDGFVVRLKQLQDDKFRANMGQQAREEAERWGWEAATAVLRNNQYEKAILNAQSRISNGMGRPGTTHLWRWIGWRFRRFFMRITGQLKKKNNDPPAATAAVPALRTDP